MKTTVLRNKGMVLSLVLAMGAVVHPAIAADVHSHQGAGLAKLELNAGKKWATDAPLRKGMTEIRNAIDRDEAAIHQGKLSAAGYGALAKTIDTQVAYIVTNCKLPPDADAQLHLVLAEIMHGSSAMKGQEKGVTSKAGAEKIVAALDAYGRHFEHAGWQRLAH